MHWTGDKVLVFGGYTYPNNIYNIWGGNDQIFLNDGGIYNPTTNQWSPIPSLNPTDSVGIKIMLICGQGMN